MKKETIITAVIFLAVGFLAGYITEAQLEWSGHQKTTQTVAAPPEMPPAGGAVSAPAGGAATPQGLPEGHPPIDSAAVIKQMEDMAAQKPKDPNVRLNLANFLYDQKQYSKAIEWYQRALEISPKDVNARTDLGTAYFYTGRPQDALREYDKALELDPKHEQTILNSIVVNVEGTHDLAAAQKAWDRLSKLNPNHPALAGLKEQINAARTSGSAAGPH
jgi:cytochrome c-type biogenesis protein CcmH/NrfG